MGLGKTCDFSLLLLLASVWFVTQVDAQMECSQGNVTCVGVSNTVTTGNLTWCCPTPAAGMVPNIEYYTATNQTCTCITEAENIAQLEAKIIHWADTTKDSGRMCRMGDLGCRGSWSNSTINNKFKYCCPTTNNNSSITITIFAGTDARYIGCRCPQQNIPKPRCEYLVPPTGLVNSTGESCRYNFDCLDNPPLSCSDPVTQTTLCCYGSRGLQVKTEGEITKCTCTNELYQASCPASIQQIPGEEQGRACLPTCSNLTSNSDTCSDAAGVVNRECCPSNMVAVVGSCSSQCWCSTREKDCTPSSAACLPLGIYLLVLLPLVALFMLGG